MLRQYESIASRLNYMHELIARKSTGPRKEFARKIGISESNLALYLRYFKNNGVKINYDYINGTYYYDDDNQKIYECGFGEKKEQ
ncbi:MAG: hypothetical protein WBA74_18675 [Cyclobacteriaceae bacterium]